MEIKNKDIKKSKFNLSNTFIKRTLIAILFISYSLGLVSVNNRRNDIKNFVKNKLSNSTKKFITDSFPYQVHKSGYKLNFIKNYIDGLSFNIEPLILDIKYKDYSILLKKRNEALKKGVLLTDENDYVDAKISINDSKLKAKIRLKGDWTDHLQNKKWSYRVRIKDNKTLFGMNKFSLQSPGTRNYLFEWIFLKLLKEEGLPSLRYQFRPLIVNGDYMGAYAIEEHFDKILLESNSFKEAPILKLSESLIWEIQAKYGSWEGVGINKQKYSTGFKLKKIKKNNILQSNFNIGNQLLNNFHSGEYKTSDVFDIDLLAKYFAIVELTNSHHSLAWHNMRFYYDPFKIKLIPIGFDGSNFVSKINNLAIEKSNKWMKLFFEDQTFTKKYYENLNRISDKKYLDYFFKKYKKEIENNKKVLYKSFPAYNFNKEVLYDNQNRIKKIIKPFKPLIVFKQNIDKSEINLSIANHQSFPIELTGILLDKNFYNLNSSNYLINGTKINQVPKYKNIKFNNFNKLNKYDSISLIYKLKGSNKINQSKVIDFPRMNQENLILSKNNILEDLTKYKFLEIDKESKKIFIKDGFWDITEPLIFPPNYEIIGSSGIQINLKQNGNIISYSPLKFFGTKANPIIIKSSGGKGGNGIAIINAKKLSLLRNVNFLNIDSIKNNKMILSGSVTFYESPVEIDNCIFENGLAEDSLNIVRSNFILNNLIFNGAASDALDIDFSDGLISNVYINNSQNDGLDISGSKIKLRNIFIDKANDKALSVGENSELSIDKINIRNSFIGIANKDSSSLKINFANITNSKIDFSGFQKKFEYDGSNTEIINLNKKYDEFNYLLSKGSTLIINNKTLKPNIKNENILKSLYK